MHGEQKRKEMAPSAHTGRTQAQAFFSVRLNAYTIVHSATHSPNPLDEH